MVESTTVTADSEHKKIHFFSFSMTVKRYLVPTLFFKEINDFSFLDVAIFSCRK